MKLKAVVLGVAVAPVGASVAFAGPPAGKGKPATTGAGCKPMISVILTGTLAADAGTAPTSLSVKVTGGNHVAKAWKNQSASIALTSSTKVNRAGAQYAADLKSGDKGQHPGEVVQGRPRQQRHAGPDGCAGDRARGSNSLVPARQRTGGAARSSAAPPIEPAAGAD